MSTINVRELINQYLASQDIDQSELPELLKPTQQLENDPFLIKDSREWLNQLFNHKDDEITVVGDYDADGILASAVMREGLNILNIGKQVNTYVPTRMDGYGITPVSVQRLMQQFPNTQTIVTVDNGVAAFEGVQAAKDLGLTVLVTDHHLAKPEGLPIADAIVDINRPGDDYPFKGISGTAMAYKMLQAYASIINPGLSTMIEQLKVLVGISTVTDMMPMRHENRYWVVYALSEVQNALDHIKTPHANNQIYTLIQVLDQKNKLFNKVADEDMFGFTIGPILNAPSRVTGTPQLAYDYFMTTDQEELVKLANELIETNDHRKAIVGETAEKISQNYEDANLHAIATTVPLTAGFVGLIAGNLTQHFNLPAIAFSTVDFDGTVLDQPTSVLHGSARSIPGVSIVAIMQEMLRREPDIILGYGGHAAAAGVTIQADHFDHFVELFDQVTQELASSVDTTEDATLPSNAFVIDPEDVSIPMLNAFNRLAPFGQDLPKPMFIFQNVNTSHPNFMGDKKQHIKFNIGYTMELIKWRGSSEFTNLGTPNLMNVAGDLSISEFRGRRKIQMIVDNWNPVV